MHEDPFAWLRRSGAQADVIDGLSRRLGATADWPTLWKECPRGDWLLGIAARLGAPHPALVRAAVSCARLATDGPPPEPIARVLDAAARWAEDPSSADEVAAATRALEAAAAGAADPPSEAAMRAALAVGLGVADREVLSSAAAAATEAVILASIDCGMELAMRWAHDKCASAVRDAVPWSLVEGCVPRAETTP